MCRPRLTQIFLLLGLVCLLSNAAPVREAVNDEDDDDQIVNEEDERVENAERRETSHKDCKYHEKTVKHGEEAYKDVCGKLECREGELSWYYWPNADYIPGCHVPAPLAHGHHDHDHHLLDHHCEHGLDCCEHGHDCSYHGHDLHGVDYLHHDDHHLNDVPVTVHVHHVHHPEHQEEVHHDLGGYGHEGAYAGHAGYGHEVGYAHDGYVGHPGYGGVIDHGGYVGHEGYGGYAHDGYGVHHAGVGPYSWGSTHDVYGGDFGGGHISGYRK